MDNAILIFAIIGVLMFCAYVYFIIKTSYDDEKQKKLDKIKENSDNNISDPKDVEQSEILRTSHKE